MKKGIMAVWTLIVAILAFLASLPKRYIDNAVKAGIFRPVAPQVMAAVETDPQTGFGMAITWAGHDIGHARDINYSGITVGVIEASDHDSARKAKYAGLIDDGEVSFDLYFIFGDTTGQKYLLADCKARTEQQVVITFPDGGTITFNAICTKFGEFKGPVEGMVEASVVMTVNGEASFSDIE
jgi:hypothetical protein